MGFGVTEKKKNQIRQVELFHDKRDEKQEIMHAITKKNRSWQDPTDKGVCAFEHGEMERPVHSECVRPTAVANIDFWGGAGWRRAESNLYDRTECEKCFFELISYVEAVFGFHINSFERRDNKSDENNKKVVIGFDNQIHK